LYRVAQESLRNIGKHAGVSDVHVTLRHTSRDISVLIHDSGRGFDRQKLERKGGLGLVSMEERLRIVGGTFAIRSQPGDGTLVEATIPLAR
jgi:signal transduction histidine kinase